VLGALLGRTMATIAELCFALQCGLFVQRLSDVTRMALLEVRAQAFVPLVILPSCAAGTPCYR
jgi:hypothetical protein